jgi:hypothetical protein
MIDSAPHRATITQPREENGLDAGRYDEEFYVFSSVWTFLLDAVRIVLHTFMDMYIFSYIHYVALQ